MNAIELTGAIFIGGGLVTLTFACVNGMAYERRARKAERALENARLSAGNLGGGSIVYGRFGRSPFGEDDPHPANVRPAGGTGIDARTQCGGCGQMVTPEEIETCPGAPKGSSPGCPNFKKVSLSGLRFDPVSPTNIEPEQPGKLITQKGTCDNG